MIDCAHKDYSELPEPFDAPIIEVSFSKISYEF